ncbi:carboxypeptidase Y-deficient [Blastocladiella emersonii ATCC 22665]|nr:carboxypeptidase Y-deficient [Blastocladiella emersonii ATCC 22665]
MSSSSSPAFNAARRRSSAPLPPHPAAAASQPLSTSPGSVGKQGRSMTSTSLASTASATSTTLGARDESARPAARKGDGVAVDECVTHRRTKLFLRRRKVFSERHNLEANRLQSRLRKLVELGANPSLTLPQLRDAEQALVAWEPDDAVAQCPFCTSTFGFLNRKHHCRLCGRAVCGKCSNAHAVDETLSIRLCCGCLGTLAARRARRTAEPPIVKYHAELAGIKAKVEDTLPRLEDTVAQLRRSKQTTNDPALKRTRTLAMTYKRDMDQYVGQITQLCQSITRLATSSDQDARVHGNVVRAFSESVQSWAPRLNDAAEAISTSARAAAASRTASTTAALATDTGATAAAGESQAYLDTLVEQYVQLEAFAREAAAQRQIENVRTLRLNMDEIGAEIARVEVAMFGETKFASGRS